MQISKLKKYISWNIISLIGFACAVITAVFWFMLNIASSGMNIRDDIDGYFSEYIMNYLIKPYFEMFKFQLLVISALLIGSRFEHKNYINNGQEGLRLFEDNQKIYSVVFTTGIFFNLLPLMLLFIIVVGYWLKHLL